MKKKQKSLFAIALLVALMAGIFTALPFWKSEKKQAIKPIPEIPLAEEEEFNQLQLVELRNPAKYTPPRIEKSPIHIFKEADYMVTIHAIEECIRGKKDEVGDFRSKVGAGIFTQRQEEMYVITAAHLQSKDHKLVEILVTFKNDRDFKFQASVIAINKKLDAALLKLEPDLMLNKVPVPKFKRSRDLEVGERVHALGSPSLTKFAQSTGTIMSIITEQDFSGLPATFMIVHDATVERGNSGGPLVNRYGEIIGMNILAHGIDSVKMAVAVPIADVLDWIDEVLTKNPR